jgi:oligoribonuclease
MQPMEKLFWIDLEMTGLEVAREVILECAVIITDLEFSTLETYHSIIKQDQVYLDAMDEWNKKHHGDSGLTAQIPTGKLPKIVENDLVDLCKRHFPDPKNRPVLAGNSISQDRLFINKYWPAFAGLLHYRMLDVTSWKIILKDKYNISYEKKGTHRALDDIQESINELKHYLSFIKV